MTWSTTKLKLESCSAEASLTTLNRMVEAYGRYSCGRENITDLCEDVIQGSFATIVLRGEHALRVVSWRSEKVINGCRASLSTYPQDYVLAYGTLQEGDSSLTNSFFMLTERLSSLTDDISAISILKALQDQIGDAFHNDLRPDNLMLRRDGSLLIIDRDLMQKSVICLAVSNTQFIRLEIPCRLQLSAVEVMFNNYYDLFHLALSVEAKSTLAVELVDLLIEISSSSNYLVFAQEFVNYLNEDQRKTIPVEVLVRHPSIEAVSVNLFDLRTLAVMHTSRTEAELNLIIRLLDSQGIYK